MVGRVRAAVAVGGQEGESVRDALPSPAMPQFPACSVVGLGAFCEVERGASRSRSRSGAARTAESCRIPAPTPV